ncbi:hypothetical protein BROUX41_002497 [Berkeleyomyces rouxiae]
MSAIDAIRAKWRRTFVRGSSLAGLREGVRYNGDQSPCIVGYRSLCWKVFLLFEDRPAADWPSALAKARRAYSGHRESLLGPAQKPDSLSSLDGDPLDDDPKTVKSPWNIAREDTAMRLEIEQDVRRLPDDPLYHTAHVQAMVADILFVYCKLNPKRGGYRQGMHELVAPIISVLTADAVDRRAVTATTPADTAMLDILDQGSIEHDGFAIFSRIMEKASVYYEFRKPPTPAAASADAPCPAPAGPGADPATSGDTSMIVKKSKHIHEAYLRKTDPQLAQHFKDVGILPQIFLIRWLRLLFSREFPFEDLLVFWDTIFAVDPNLELIDLICVAMMLRIRWMLIEADYAGCLQLLLKYPAPTGENGPHTFVEDALSLRLHLNPTRGAAIIQKYSMRTPELPPAPGFRSPSLEPIFGGLSLNGSYPMPSPSRFINQPGGVEALLQGAARGVMERGEKLGINQAVRDAMGELKKNVQQLQEAAKPTISLNGEAQAYALERKNLQLAEVVGEVVDSLKQLATPAALEDRQKSIEMMEVLAAKLQSVRVSLTDASFELAPMPDASTRAAPVGVADETAEPLFAAASDTGGDGRAEAACHETAGDGTHAAGGPVEAGKAAGVARPSIAESSLAWMLLPSEDGGGSGSSSSKGHGFMARDVELTSGTASRRQTALKASRERNSFLFGERQGAEE